MNASPPNCAEMDVPTGAVCLGVVEREGGYDLAVAVGAAFVDLHVAGGLPELRDALRPWRGAPVVGLGFAGPRPSAAADWLGVDRWLPEVESARALAVPAKGVTRFHGWESLEVEFGKLVSCKGCAKGCEVQVVRAPARAVLGGACDRWEQGAAPAAWDDPLALSSALLARHTPSEIEGKPTFLHEASPASAAAPLWFSLLRAAGRVAVWAAPSEGPACQRPALAPGDHFMPQPSEGWACGAPPEAPGVIAPRIRAKVGLGSVFHGAQALADSLGIPPRRMAAAVQEGTAALARYQRELVELGRSALADEHARIALIVGVPCALRHALVRDTLGAWLRARHIVPVPVDAVAWPGRPLLGALGAPTALGSLLPGLLHWAAHPRVFPVVVRVGACLGEAELAQLWAAVPAEKPRWCLSVDRGWTDADLDTRGAEWSDAVWSKASVEPT